MLEFLEWLAKLGRPPKPEFTVKVVREYQVQMRSRNTAGGWTSWDWCGSPMTGAEADEWLKLKKDLPSAWVEFRMMMIPRV